MSITLGRIDFRLLHGIVATMWAPQSGAQRVMVIDDKVANDPIIKESMRLGKPAGMACSIITLETAIKNFKAGKYDNHKVFVVTENPETFLKLQEEAGQKIPRIVLGITRNNKESYTHDFDILLFPDCMESSSIFHRILSSTCQKNPAPMVL